MDDVNRAINLNWERSWCDWLLTSVPCPWTYASNAVTRSYSIVGGAIFAIGILKVWKSWIVCSGGSPRSRFRTCIYCLLRVTVIPWNSIVPFHWLYLLVTELTEEETLGSGLLIGAVIGARFENKIIGFRYHFQSHLSNEMMSESQVFSITTPLSSSAVFIWKLNLLLNSGKY